MNEKTKHDGQKPYELIALMNMMARTPPRNHKVFEHEAPCSKHLRPSEHHRVR